MPELAAVGRVADPEQLDLEPIIVPIVAYKVETREEVEERIPFKPVMPPGVQALVERLGGQTVGINSCLAMLDGLVMPDAKERWTEFVESDELAIPAETLAELTRALIEHYGERPTKRPSRSSRTGGRSGRTSKGEQPSTG